MPFDIVRQWWNRVTTDIRCFCARRRGHECSDLLNRHPLELRRGLKRAQHARYLCTPVSLDLTPADQCVREARDLRVKTVTLRRAQAVPALLRRNYVIIHYSEQMSFEFSELIRLEPEPDRFDQPVSHVPKAVIIGRREPCEAGMSNLRLGGFAFAPIP